MSNGSAINHRTCPDQEVTSSDLLDGFEHRKIPDGCLLATPGQADDFVFVVKSGRLRVYLQGESRLLTLSFLEPGDIYTSHTPTYVEASEDSEILVMSTSKFGQKLACDSSAAPQMMRVLGRLLSNAVNLVEDLAFREVPARLARFLIGLAERRGKATEQGLLVEMDLNTEEIASLLGSTRQTVSSLINQWEREGILLRQGRQSLMIRSVESLKTVLVSAG